MDPEFVGTPKETRSARDDRGLPSVVDPSSRCVWELQIRYVGGIMKCLGTLQKTNKIRVSLSRPEEQADSGVKLVLKRL
jgi:hypothetical protein